MFLKITLFSVCMCASVCFWRPEDNLGVLVLSSHDVGLRNWTQALRLLQQSASNPFAGPPEIYLT